MVVGARSAVFAPVRDLRLIVVDEEHEPAYKQDETPRYHGRDVAVMRAKLAGAVCLLGSATPSLEMLRQRPRRANTAWPTLTPARRRPAAAGTSTIVDMRIEVMRAARPRRRCRGSWSTTMHDRFERREQTILFINRRGYSSSMLCTEVRARGGRARIAASP